jgi:hypothetical protein
MCFYFINADKRFSWPVNPKLAWGIVKNFTESGDDDIIEFSDFLLSISNAISCSYQCSNDGTIAFSVTSLWNDVFDSLLIWSIFL